MRDRVGEELSLSSVKIGFLKGDSVQVRLTRASGRERECAREWFREKFSGM